MAKQNINVGTAANDKKGDSLRAAFQKVNANFTELYTALGINADVNLNIGAFEFAGSVMSTTDSTAIVIDQATTISSNLTVGGDVLPSVANGGDLGSSARPWKSLYVSNNTIFIGGVPLGLDANGNLTVNGSLITGGGVTSYADLTGKPTLFDGAYSSLSGKPALFSGSYADLTNKPNLAGTYQFSVAADDSTQRVISTDEVIKFIGAGGITTASDAEGNITITFDGNLRVNNGILYNNLNQDIWIDPSNSQEHSGYIRIPGPPNLNSNPIIIENSQGGGVKIRSNANDWIFGLNGSLTLPSIGKIVNNNKEWTFSGDGSLTLPGDIKSNGNINIDINLADSTLRRWSFGEDGALTFPDGTNQSTAYQVTKSITHTSNLLAGPSSFGQGSSIAITDNYQTERVSITNSLGGIARATLANITVIGKIVILTSTSPHETFVDRYGWSGATQSYVTVSNNGNGVVILMSLGSNGWKLISTNE